MVEKDRRVASRVKVNLSAKISPNGYHTREVKVENISLSGMLIKSDIPLFSLSTLLVDIDLEGKKFKSKAICVRVSDKAPFQAGIHFINIDDQSRKILEEFISTKLKIEGTN